MAFTAKDVKALREQTGAGMMDCKKALTESDGDFDKAVEYLREKGLAAAAKKSDRIAAEGVVFAEVDPSLHAGLVLEVNAETDFVAKNDSFQEFVRQVADTILKQNPADLDTLLALKAEGSDLTVAEVLHEKVLTIGENIKIRRFVRLEGDLITYIHGGGRIGVLVQFDTDVAGKDGFGEYGKDIAMQIAAMNPRYLNEQAVPADVVEEEKKVLTVQAMNEGKPQNIAEKMVNGRIRKFFKEICLVDQEFVKDADLTVSKYTEETAKKLGGGIKITQFVRFEKGEGLEKRHDDLAAEVAGMVK
ncbi:translation elongation factor Ts [Ethanoligenens harbinense]|uniref:Elongation factor Ts n=1 Tax=Ethanoligenens harbinense (strain DSM 18485 / JCM 12961 / CGMCC 1.5033 / YUAN-3) TaxID=663278 RepID=E6U8S4_ETHHY|nr:translation elongation factor Ts [Ethanoligenens harbinense]ADU27159.1 translation elongation factor Ts [Ethanoligenens harbinense YUAN-3]AVQ96230.1 elongation factor Ts [Ethanoligenens harbinense YUAN-3]AYF38890.1 elongation factor Ts [Ethanoligenens harbinense]AYF41640.1 elongation factor Ts [Ethanoligenens harbinense]QCN92471.1 elongation factor Ts [Ethanoligenens harbinense]